MRAFLTGVTGAHWPYTCRRRVGKGGSSPGRLQLWAEQPRRQRTNRPSRLSFRKVSPPALPAFIDLACLSGCGATPQQPPKRRRQQQPAEQQLEGDGAEQHERAFLGQGPPPALPCYLVTPLCLLALLGSPATSQPSITSRQPATSQISPTITNVTSHRHPPPAIASHRQPLIASHQPAIDRQPPASHLPTIDNRPPPATGAWGNWNLGR